MRFGWYRTFFGMAFAFAAIAVKAAALEVRVTDASGKPIPGAVIHLESPEAKQVAKPLSGIEIAQANKTFVPIVTVVPVGTSIAFPNRDTVRHHVYSFSSAKRFEIKLYVGTPANPVVFDRPGIAVLGCNIHDHMAAWVVVVETPWYGQTDSEGRWRASNVPVGNYRLRTWHTDLPVGSPALEQALTVGTAGTQAFVTLTGLRP